MKSVSKVNGPAEPADMGTSAYDAKKIEESLKRSCYGHSQLLVIINDPWEKWAFVKKYEL